MAELQGVNGDSLQWLVDDVIAVIDAGVDDPVDRANVANVAAAIIADRDRDPGPRQESSRTTRGDRVRSRLRFEDDDDA